MTVYKNHLPLIFPVIFFLYRHLQFGSDDPSVSLVVPTMPPTRLNQQRTVGPVGTLPLPTLAISIIESLQAENRRLTTLYSNILVENTQQKEKCIETQKQREDMANRYMERKEDLMQ